MSGFHPFPVTLISLVSPAGSMMRQARMQITKKCPQQEKRQLHGLRQTRIQNAMQNPLQDFLLLAAIPDFTRIQTRLQTNMPHRPCALAY